MIDKTLLLNLADIHQPHCISIYFRMEGYKKNQITLKNLAREAEKVLEKTYGLDEREIKNRLSTVYKLEDEVKWMSKPHGDVAIFLFGEESEVIEFDGIDVSAQVHVTDHLYLLPLAPLVNRSHKLYLLTLSANNVGLYEIYDKQIRKSEYAKHLPQNMESVVGKDVEDKSLQSHSTSVESNIHHGQGAGSDNEKKLEYHKYFQEIDRQLSTHINDQSVPLVIACVDYLFPIYEEVNSYKTLHKQFIAGNFDQSNQQELFKEGQKIMCQFIDEKLNESKSNFEGQLSKQLASIQIQDIVPSSFEGKIESLFVKEGTEIIGRYHKDQHKIEVEIVDKVNNDSLVNMAALNTVKADGEVFIIPQEQMPMEADVCAVYRYNLKE